MLSYLKKFVMDILPSVAATIIGAYIVNHYIVAKPQAPEGAAVTAAVDPKAAAKPAEKSAMVSSLPEAGVKAKGMSERTLIERSASEKATVTEKPADPKSADPKSADTKSADTKADAPADTASIPADRHHPAAPKAVAKATPAAAPQPAAPATSAAPVEAAVTPEETRDANDLARAAIERLRKERPQEAARTTDIARLPDQQRPATPSAIRPLPPPIMVSNPSTDNVDQSQQQRPPYAASAQDANRDANRLTPPADIPVPVLQAPLDLHAEAVIPAQKNERTSVTDDMFSGVKSMFHAVLPK